MSHAVPGIHSAKGFLCDLCGLHCDPEKEELNALDCTFGNCDPDCSVYHQECLEKYLRKVNLEKNRKSGYTCPRGTGKGTKYPDRPCPGKINKSHPIHIRNDGAKKRRKAQMPAQLPDMRPPKAEPKDKAKNQEDEKQKAKERKARDEALTAGHPASSKEEAARQQKLKLQAAAYAARRDLGLAGKSGGVMPSAALSTFKASLGKPNQTLDEFEARRAPPKTNAASAWGGGKLEQRAHGNDSGYGYVAPGRRDVADKVAQEALKPSLKLTTAADKHKGETVGMQSPEKEEAGKLSKAQRKNLKRAEKKAADRTTERMSVASSDFVSDADLANLDLATMEFDNFSITAIDEEGKEEDTFFDESSLQNECSQAITLFKAQALILQLGSIGFPDWQCVPAVMAHGSNLEAAVAWMLEGSVDSEEQAQELLRGAEALPQIDITEELARLQEVKDELRLELSMVQEEVLGQMGDVDAACQAIHDRHGTAPQTHQPALQEPVYAPERKDSWVQVDHSAYGRVLSDYAAPGQGNGHTHNQGGWNEMTQPREVAPPTWQPSTFQGDAQHNTSAYDPRQNSGYGYQPQASYQTQEPQREGAVVNNMERYNQLLGLDPPRAKEVGQYQSIFGDAPQQQRPSNFSGLGGSELRRPTWDQPASNGWAQGAAHPGNATSILQPHKHQQEETDLDFNNLLEMLMP